MKKVVFNFGLVLVAFIIGLAINQACADSFESMSDGEIKSLVSKLQQDVITLRNEVSELRSELSSIKNQGPSTSPSSDLFDVDDLTFHKDGNVANRCLSAVTSARYIYPDRIVTIDGHTEYEYDSYGRLSSMASYDGSGVETSRYFYEYDGKKLIRKTSNKTDEYTQEYITEIIYD